MIDLHRVQIAERQLDRVLQFASRIESKVSVLLATNLGIFAIMLTNLSYADIRTWYIATPLAIGLIMISQSIFLLYQATYPRLEGGSSSLIYFFEIAKRTEHNYQRDFNNISLEDLYFDLAGQIWRNSQIMSKKFISVHKSFSWTLWSIVPWVVFLIASSVTHGRSILVN